MKVNKCVEDDDIIFYFMQGVGVWGTVVETESVCKSCHQAGCHEPTGVAI